MFITGLDDSLTPMTETDQMCSISYDKGIEEMVLSVGADVRDRTAVWIFPVPAKPGDVTIGINKSFPEYHGSNLKTIIKKAVKDASWLMYASQIWPVASIWLWWSGIFNVGQGNLVIGGNFEGIQVYSHEESMGLSTELVSADDGESLIRYLQSKGMNVSAGSLKSFEDYAGNRYSYVVSWVSDASEYKKESSEHPLSVQVKFATPKMYYPLKPTSMYGSEYVPATLYVKGHVTPEIYSDIRQYAKTSYYLALDGSKYTKIIIDAPSNKFTDDLWIADNGPLHIMFMNAAASNTLVVVLAMFLFCSVLASLYAGSIVFGIDYDKRELLIYGLANILSLAGVALVVFLRTKRTWEKDTPQTDQSSWGNYLLAIIAVLFCLGLLSTDLLGNRLSDGNPFGIILALGYLIIIMIAMAIHFPLTLLIFIIPLLLFYLASRDERWAFVCHFSIAFLLSVVFFTTIVSQALYDPESEGGFVKMQPLHPSIAYQNRNFTISFNNALDAPVRIERLGMKEEISGEKCNINPLQEKTVKAGGTFTLLAECPPKSDGESYSIGIEIGYRSVEGEEMPVKTERGAIKGQGEPY